MSRASFRIAAWSALAGALVVSGYLLINTTRMPYDDEGFLLISYRNYLAGLRLYDDVFSQYGPWPYVYHQLLTLGRPEQLTHMFGRAVTLFHWVAMALCCGLITWRLVRSQLAAFTASAFAFTLTWQMTAEPSHPGSNISFLVALAGTLVAFLPGARRPALLYAGLGVLTGLLLLTKINVGLLLAAGIGCFVLRYTAWGGAGRMIAWAGPVGLLAVPWVLLGGQLHQSRVLTFAVVFTLAAAGLLWVTPSRLIETRLAPRSWVAAAVAMGVTIAVLCVWVGLRGTSMESLLQTVLLNPLRMPARFMVGINWYPPALPVALIVALITGLAGRDLRRRGDLGGLTSNLLMAARSIAFATFLVQITRWPTYYGIFHFVCYCLPLVALFVVPLNRSAEEPRRLALWGVAGIALLQVLHAFPVAGSQLGWATFLCVPVLIAGLWELGDAVATRWATHGRRLVQAGGLVLAAGATLVLGLFLQTGWDRYRMSRPLDLPGAESIYLDGISRMALRMLNLNASIHTDVLFSRQGMYSHNLWSGVPTPTAQNATHWFWLLDDAQQRDIITRLAATPRTAFITSNSLDRFMVDFKVPVAGPLQDFLQQHYRRLFAYGDFTFNVPQESPAVVFGRYEVREADSTEAGVPPLRFQSNVLLDGTPARIGLEMIDYPWAPGPELFSKAAHAVVEPIDRQGRVLGPAIDLATTPRLRGLYRLSVFSPRLPAGLPWQDYALVVRGPDDAVLSESAY